MNEQISMFELLGEPVTPLIPFEEQKKGKHGWIMDISALLLRENGFREDAVCVCTRPVIFEENSKKDRNGRTSQMARSTHGPYMGWRGGYKDVYSRRPTWKECLEYAHKRYAIPEKVLYYERDGRDNEIWEYENGYSKEGGA
jgi:hypothetical protein